jgi:hypothetical protein
MTTSTTSRRAFLTASAIAASGVLMAGRLVSALRRGFLPGMNPPRTFGRARVTMQLMRGWRHICWICHTRLATLAEPRGGCHLARCMHAI